MLSVAHAPFCPPLAAGEEAWTWTLPSLRRASPGEGQQVLSVRPRCSAFGPLHGGGRAGPGLFWGSGPNGAKRTTRCPGANLEADRSTWAQFKVSGAWTRREKTRWGAVLFYLFVCFARGSSSWALNRHVDFKKIHIFQGEVLGLRGSFSDPVWGLHKQIFEEELLVSWWAQREDRFTGLSGCRSKHEDHEAIQDGSSFSVGAFTLQTFGTFGSCSCGVS